MFVYYQKKKTVYKTEKKIPISRLIREQIVKALINIRIALGL